MVASGSGPVIRADAAERARRAYELRLSGLGWARIAEEVGFASRQGAARAAARHVGQLPAPDVERMRQESGAVLAFARGKAMQAVQDERSGALRDLVAVEARLAQLHGLDVANAGGVSVNVGVGVGEVGQNLIAAIHAQAGPPRFESGADISGELGNEE